MVDDRAPRVAVEDVRYAPVRIPALAGWRGREVGPREGGRSKPQRRVELRRQLGGEAVQACLFEGPGVPCDKPAGLGIPAVVTKPAGAVQGVKAGPYELSAVADVVKPGGVSQRRSPVRFNQVGDAIDLRCHSGGVLKARIALEANRLLSRSVCERSTPARLRPRDFLSDRGAELLRESLLEDRVQQLARQESGRERGGGEQCG